MKEAFSQNQKITLNSGSEKQQKESQKKQKKTPVKKETLQKLVDMQIDIKKVFYEEDALALIEEKEKQKKVVPKKSAKEQIELEAATLAEKLNIPVSESVGVKAILESIKIKIDSLKQQAGHDIEKMAEALSFEVSYKAIKTDFEIYNNTTNRLGVASLADYNRFRLGL